MDTTTESGTWAKYHVLRFDGSRYNYQCPSGLIASGPWEKRPRFCGGICCGRELIEQSTLDAAIEQARAADTEQLARLQRAIVTAIENLESDHVTPNLHRMGLLGKSDVESAINELRAAL